jgi:hypothetical protein
MYAINVDLNQWAVQRLKGLLKIELSTKWEKRNARARFALQSQVELGRDALAAALRARGTRSNAEIDRFLWHAHDAQLTALSNLYEPSSSAVANAVDFL